MSDKQKRQLLKARKDGKREKEAALLARLERSRRDEELRAALARGELPVEPSRLVAGNSYGSQFMLRGTYRPIEFTCRACGKAEIWTPEQQKWWYEVAKGDINSTAVMCRPCRRRERERSAEARRVHLEGVARKKASRGADEQSATGRDEA